MYRLRKQGQLVEAVPEMKAHLSHFTKIFQDMTSKTGKPLSKHTVDSYIARLNRLHVLCEGKPISSTSLMWLSDPDKVIEKLRDSELGSKKDYLSGVIKLLDSQGVEPAVIKKYSASLSSFKESEDKVRGDNKAKQEVVDGFVDLKEVNKRIDAFVKKLSDLTDDELVKLLIVCMYYKSELIPRNDLGQFKLIDKGKSKKMNDEFNYVLTEKRGDTLFPTALVMNNYKTKQTYGRRKFDMTATLAKVMFEYFKRWKKANGDYLFVNSKNEPFSKVNFLNLLRQATEMVVGKQQTVDTIRRSIITHEYEMNPLMTINEKQLFANRFLHSPAKQAEYVSTNLKSGSDD